VDSIYDCLRCVIPAISSYFFGDEIIECCSISEVLIFDNFFPVSLALMVPVSNEAEFNVSTLHLFGDLVNVHFDGFFSFDDV